MQIEHHTPMQIEHHTFKRSQLSHIHTSQILICYVGTIKVHDSVPHINFGGVLVHLVHPIQLAWHQLVSHCIIITIVQKKHASIQFPPTFSSQKHDSLPTITAHQETGTFYISNRIHQNMLT